jgi:hypothetical protein
MKQQHPNRNDYPNHPDIQNSLEKWVVSEQGLVTYKMNLKQLMVKNEEMLKNWWKDVSRIQKRTAISQLRKILDIHMVRMKYSQLN